MLVLYVLLGVLLFTAVVRGPLFYKHEPFFSYDLLLQPTDSERQVGFKLALDLNANAPQPLAGVHLYT